MIFLQGFFTVLPIETTHCLHHPRRMMTTAIPVVRDWRKPSLLRPQRQAIVIRGSWDTVPVYPLAMTNIAMERSTIFKNGKPSMNGSFSMAMLNNQRVVLIYSRHRLVSLFFHPTKSGWWFGTMEFHDFPYIGNFIIPTDFHIFQRGRSTTNQK